MNPPAPSQIRFAQIGCGLIGKKRAAALKTLAPDAALACACDTDRSRAEALAASVPGCRVAGSIEEVLADASISAVIVSTLNAALAPIARAAAAAGRHVIVEKPGALDAGQLRSVQEAAKRTGAKVRISYNHRYHPALQKARELVDAGAVGPLMFLRARYGHGGRTGYDREWRADPKLSGGGELIDQGVHLIDLAGWFMGDFAQVDGHATTSFWKMPVDDNAFVSLRTAAGQTAWLHASCTEWKNLFSLEIYGRDGKLAIDGLGGSYGVERLAFYRMLPEMGPPETTLWEYPRGDDSWAVELREFLADIRQDREPSPGLTEAIRTLDVVAAIYQKSGYLTHA
ncbi:MAG TPA: Gfo/Idh/MocA family oxidoreductase [Opitutaceae bacterium]|jgi:predicted dehydrogenase